MEGINTFRKKFRLSFPRELHLEPQQVVTCIFLGSTSSRMQFRSVRSCKWNHLDVPKKQEPRSTVYRRENTKREAY